NPGRPYDDTLVDLSSYAGQTVQLRWRLASDSSVGREGWYVDDIRVEGCSSDGNFADLSLSVMAAPDPVENGSQLTYVATVGNFGPETALDVEVDFDLPAGSRSQVPAACSARARVCTARTGAAPVRAAP